MKVGGKSRAKKLYLAHGLTEFVFVLTYLNIHCRIPVTLDCQRRSFQRALRALTLLMHAHWQR
jgi:hypothetical protein